MTKEEFLRILPSLVSGYRAAPDVLDRIAKVNLVMVIGPSGVGKTSLIEASGLPFVPSDTTREPRASEQEGIDFYFRKDYDQLVKDIKTGRFVQIVVGVAGDLYSTKGTSYPASGVAVMPVLAEVIHVFRSLGFAHTTSVFICPPSYKEWMRRLNTHKVTKEQLAKRLNEAKKSFKFGLADQEVHFIINDDLEVAVEQLKHLISGKTDESREQNGRDVAVSLLSVLSN
jgi:guanylate kinase